MIVDQAGGRQLERELHPTRQCGRNASSESKPFFRHAILLSLISLFSLIGSGFRMVIVSGVLLIGADILCGGNVFDQALFDSAPGSLIAHELRFESRRQRSWII